MKHSEHLSGFLDFLRNCQTEYNIAEMQQEESNNATQDLLHRLELEEDGYHDLAKISKVMKQVRKDRRVAKDTIQKLQPIVDWTKGNQKTIHDLERLLGTVRDQENKTSGRFYNPKTDIIDKVFEKKVK